jgi:hypothetical protein
MSTRNNWFDFTKQRFQKKGVIFTLTEQELEDLYNGQNGKCAYCNEDINYPSLIFNTKNSFKLSLIDPALGYTFENTKLVCPRISQMKQHMGEQEFYDLCEVILSSRKEV